MLAAQLLSGFGLAGAAGLNAYIPLLGVALLGRFGVIQLAPPFDLLTHGAVIAALAVLLLVEVVVDKVPAADHVNDLVMTVLRPLAGAIVFAGASGAVHDVPPVVLVIAGLVTAFGVHAAKAAARPVVNVSTVGLGAPVVSLVEDVTAALFTAAAVLAPVLVLVLAALCGWGAWAVWQRVSKGRAAKPPATPSA